MVFSTPLACPYQTYSTLYYLIIVCILQLFFILVPPTVPLSYNHGYIEVLNYFLMQSFSRLLRNMKKFNLTETAYGNDFEETNNLLLRTLIFGVQ